MTNSRASFLAVLGFSLLVLPQMAFAASNPCKQQEKNLDHWVNGIKQRQSDELKQCAVVNSSDSYVCQDLKDANQAELRGARSHRASQMSGCRSQGPAGNTLTTDLYAAPQYQFEQNCIISDAFNTICLRYSDPNPPKPSAHYHHHHHRKDADDKSANQKTDQPPVRGQNTRGSSANNSGNRSSGTDKSHASKTGPPTGRGTGRGSYPPPSSGGGNYSGGNTDRGGYSGGGDYSGGNGGGGSYTPPTQSGGGYSGGGGYNGGGASGGGGSSGGGVDRGGGAAIPK